MRIGIVYDRDLIKKQASFTNLTPSDGSLNNIFLKRYDGELIEVPMSHAQREYHILFYSLNKKSVNIVEELNDELIYLYKLINLPILICFVDFDVWHPDREYDS